MRYVMNRASPFNALIRIQTSMKLLENIRIALKALQANKLRASLTMLGIMIGVAAVITL